MVCSRHFSLEIQLITHFFPFVPRAPGVRHENVNSHLCKSICRRVTPKTQSLSDCRHAPCKFQLCSLTLREIAFSWNPHSKRQRRNVLTAAKRIIFPFSIFIPAHDTSHMYKLFSILCFAFEATDNTQTFKRFKLQKFTILS
jgi:hypothetical protein